MRPDQRTTLVANGPRLAARTLICLLLAAGCNTRDPGPAGPGPTTPPTNQQPQPQGSIPAQELQEGEEVLVNLAGVFSDPDGDQLTYSATSQRTSIVSAAVTSGSVVRIRGEGVGSATVVVRATDPAGLSATQNVTVTVFVGVCDRTAEVRDAIVDAVESVTNCASLTRSQLAEIDSLDVSDSGLSRLQTDDFGLLSGLTVLHLGSNELSQLPQPVFSNLAHLAVLDLSNNRLVELPASVFSGLSRLRDLDLHNNRLSRLPDGAFSGLVGLQSLGLDANQLSELPPNIFSDLSGLESLDLGINRLQELPASVFANLSSLQKLTLHTSKLSELPPTVFSNLSGLESLVLSNNQLRELPVGVFAGLPRMKELRLDTNQLQSLPQGVFAGLPELRNIALDGNPGSPFGLTLQFERTDNASLTAPSPATMRLVLAEGAPFHITVNMQSRGGRVSPISVSFAKGDTVSQRNFTVSQATAGNPVHVAARVPPVPDAITGIALVAPNEIVLFGTPAGLILREDFDTSSLEKLYGVPSDPGERSTTALRLEIGQRVPGGADDWGFLINGTRIEDVILKNR